MFACFLGPFKLEFDVRFAVEHGEGGVWGCGITFVDVFKPFVIALPLFCVYVQTTLGRARCFSCISISSCGRTAFFNVWNFECCQKNARHGNRFSMMDVKGMTCQLTNIYCQSFNPTQSKIDAFSLLQVHHGAFRRPISQIS